MKLEEEETTRVLLNHQPRRRLVGGLLRHFLAYSRSTKQEAAKRHRGLCYVSIPVRHPTGCLVRSKVIMILSEELGLMGS